MTSFLAITPYLLKRISSGRKVEKLNGQQGHSTSNDKVLSCLRSCVCVCVFVLLCVYNIPQHAMTLLPTLPHHQLVTMVTAQTFLNPC